MVDDYIPVADHDDLVRDPQSKAIINTDKNSYHARRKLKEKMKQDKVDQLTNDKRITQLETDIGDIKSMLLQLLHK